ncbi:protease PrsW [Thermoplasmatota archaeon]
MSILPQASLFLGIIPALFLLFLGLKGFDGYYKDKIVFLSFIIGIILGVISAAMEILSLSLGILIIVLFPILEQILKLIILNVSRLQKQKSTVIYGLSLGLGFGSVFTPISIILANFETDSIIIIASVIIGSFGIILLQAGTGIILGYGVFTGKILKYFLLTIIIHIPFTAWFFLTGIYQIEQTQILLIFYGLVVYWYSSNKIMKNILDKTKEKLK